MWEKSLRAWPSKSENSWETELERRSASASGCINAVSPEGFPFRVARSVKMILKIMLFGLQELTKGNC